MKYECVKCNKLVNQKDIIVVSEIYTQAYNEWEGTTIWNYCKECYNKQNKKKRTSRIRGKE